MSITSCICRFFFSCDEFCRTFYLCFKCTSLFPISRSCFSFEHLICVILIEFILKITQYKLKRCKRLFNEKSFAFSLPLSFLSLLGNWHLVLSYMSFLEVFVLMQANTCMSVCVCVCVCLYINYLLFTYLRSLLHGRGVVSSMRAGFKSLTSALLYPECQEFPHGDSTHSSTSILVLQNFMCYELYFLRLQCFKLVFK